MLLVADTGNSQITLGIFDGETLLHRWGISSVNAFSEDECGITILNFLDKADLTDKIDGIILSSVVSHLTCKIASTFKKYLKQEPIIVNHKTNLGNLKLNVEKNEEVGADRICNIVAGFTLYQSPVVIVDMGTATTFDVVTAQGEFIGGAICPGIGMSIDSLADKTSLLPRIEAAHINEVIARNTVTNILSGTVIAHAAMIDGMIDRIEKELGLKLTSIGTGGYSIFVEDHLYRKFDCFNPYLTLQGLKILYDLNSK